jgi:hypothetical protein
VSARKQPRFSERAHTRIYPATFPINEIKLIPALFSKKVLTSGFIYGMIFLSDLIGFGRYLQIILPNISVLYHKTITLHIYNIYQEKRRHKKAE